MRFGPGESNSPNTKQAVNKTHQPEFTLGSFALGVSGAQRNSRKAKEKVSADTESIKIAQIEIEKYPYGNMSVFGKLNK